MMHKLIFCIDIGTTSLKSALIDTAGVVHAYNRSPLVFCSHHTPQVWIDTLTCAGNKLFTSLVYDFSIIAISISGNGPTIAQKNFLLLWNEPIFNKFKPVEDTKSFFLPRLRYIKDTFPSVWNDNDFIFSGAEYLIFLLCGKAYTLLPEKRYENAYWTRKSLDLWHLEEKLPPFIKIGESFGNLLPEAARKFGIPHDKTPIPLFCGGPDFISALIGTNTLQEGAICDRAGSSEGINVCTKNPLYAEGVRTLPSVIDNLWNVSVVLPDTGKIFEDFKQKYYADYSYDALTTKLIENPCPEGKIIFNKIKTDLQQSITFLEKTLNIKIKRMKVTGGQANSDIWLSHKSTFLGITLELTRIADAELMGNAIVALYGLGFYPSLQQAANSLVQVKKEFTPQ
ncbi:MAG: hypothetical protein ACRC5H_08590 [Treponemataceae bacterium]